jgi:hypothetical protein
MKRDAIISDDGVYRYLLTRVWDEALPRLLYIMLNPSTADAKIDDPTIRSCTRIAGHYAFGGFEVVNLMAFRATKPQDLPFSLAEAAGPDNTRYIGEALDRCSTVVCAWGAHPAAGRFSASTLVLIESKGLTPMCLGVTRSGFPKHPLFLSADTPLVPYA